MIKFGNRYFDLPEVLSNIGWTIAVVLVLSFVYYIWIQFPLSSLQKQLKNLELSVSGEIKSIKINTGIAEGSFGNEVLPINIKLHYAYSFEGKTFHNEELIHWKELDSSEKKMLISQDNLKKKACIQVKFNETTPKNGIDAEGSYQNKTRI